MQIQPYRPTLRQDLVVESAGDEVLIYDPVTDTAHCLSRDAALVWGMCDGRRTAKEMEALAGLDDGVVADAVARFAETGLLEDAGPGLSRRQVVRRLAAASLAPLIVSVTAPTAHAAIVSVRTRIPCNSNGGSCPTSPINSRPCNVSNDSGCRSDAGCQSAASNTNCSTNESTQERRNCCPIGWECEGNTSCVRNV
jgi:hypothetical protein